MKFAKTCLIALVSTGVCGGYATGAILEDIPFNDVAGTAIEAAANAATAHLFDIDADLAAVTTNGSGQLNASLKSNTDFGSTYIDSDDVTTGRLWGVMELTWDFDLGSLDTAENEEIRLSLIQFDPRSTFVTSEFEIQREDDNTLTIFGNAVGTGSVDTASATLSMTQSQKFIAIVAVDLDADVTEVYYSADNGASFTTLGGGVLDPARGVASLRMVLNNDLSQDSVLIDRVYLTDTNPYPNLIADIPEPGTAALLSIGALAIVRRRA